MKMNAKYFSDEEQIMERLTAINSAAMPITETSVLYNPKRGTWISGVPYLMTAFSERAFVFADREQAESLVRDFPDRLRGYKVQVRKAQQ